MVVIYVILLWCLEVVEDVGEFKEKEGRDQTIVFIMGDLPPVISAVESPKSIYFTSLKGFLGEEMQILNLHLIQVKLIIFACPGILSG